MKETTGSIGTIDYQMGLQNEPNGRWYTDEELKSLLLKEYSSGFRGGCMIAQGNCAKHTRMLSGCFDQATIDQAIENICNMTIEELGEPE